MHVDPELSAYLDEQLALAERSRVEVHLAACERCTRRLAELRSTASLIAALPSPRPSRSLVPRVEPRWTWLRFIRSLSTVAAGAFLFVFLLTAVGSSGTGLGGGTGAPAAAPAVLPQSSAAPARPLATAAANAGADTASQKIVASAPPGVAFGPNQSPAASTPAPAGPNERGARSFSTEVPSRSPLLDPRLWLLLGTLAAVIALVTHLRLRRIGHIS